MARDDANKPKSELLADMAAAVTVWSGKGRLGSRRQFERWFALLDNCEMEDVEIGMYDACRTNFTDACRDRVPFWTRRAWLIVIDAWLRLLAVGAGHDRRPYVPEPIDTRRVWIQGRPVF